MSAALSATVFDDRICQLGEGPLWHPERQQLFWFDILGKRLMTRDGTGPAQWQFDEHVSAAGWTGRDTLLIASETALFHFDLTTGAREDLVALEAEMPETRSNDGRADPWGGFWIGTMHKTADPKCGAIYRFYQGALEVLFHDITISNSICFAPDRSCAYYTDTPTEQVMRQQLDGDGWPKGPAEVFLDLRADGLKPDGAVVDSEGCLWLAQWGAGRVARYDREARFLTQLPLAATQVTCPAFGGPDLSTLHVTSAACDLSAPRVTDGATFVAEVGVVGQAEHRVLL